MVAVKRALHLGQVLLTLMVAYSMRAAPVTERLQQGVVSRIMYGSMPLIPMNVDRCPLRLSVGGLKENMFQSTDNLFCAGLRVSHGLFKLNKHHRLVAFACDAVAGIKGKAVDKAVDVAMEFFAVVPVADGGDNIQSFHGLYLLEINSRIPGRL
jgi:hypothetical protein